MPNRVIREGILDSDRMDKLSWAGEVFYRRLHSIVDDYGCFDARGSILKSKLYPTERKQAIVSLPDIEKWILETVEAGLVRCYEVAGKPYLIVLDFNQQVRIKKRKFPAPPENCDTSAKHVSSICMSDTNPNQSESETNPTPNPKVAEVDENFRNKFLEIKTKILNDEMFRGDAGKMYQDEAMYLKAVDEFFSRKINTREYISHNLTEESNCRRNLMFWLGKNYSRIEKEFKNGSNNGKTQSNHGKIEVVISD